MMVENNNKTMGLADCSDNLALPSVDSAEFVNSCRKKHISEARQESAELNFEQVCEGHMDTC